MVPISYSCSYNNGPPEDCEHFLFLLLFDIGYICHACILGGPGPDIAIPADRFSAGVPVLLVLTLNTEGGQSSKSTVIFTPPGICLATYLY